jgi:hypothetical protein
MANGNCADCMKPGAAKIHGYRPGKYKGTIKSLLNR